MKRQKILLPIDSKGKIDWGFMESFMKQKEQELLNNVLNKLCKRLIKSAIGGG